MPIPMLIAAGVAAAGGLLGQVLGNSSREQAEAIMQRVRDEFGRIDPAKVKEVAVEVLGPSALEGLENGEEMGAMNDSLGRMGDAVKSGGMTLQDRAALNDALDEVGQQDRAQRSAITREYEGTGSQGMLAKLVAQQGSSQRSHRAGTNAAGDAQRRYWQMVSQRSGLAGDIYNKRAHTAETKDAISRWNATNRQDTQKYNNSLEQQRFDNDMRKQAGKAGMDHAAAARADATADRTQQTWSRVGEAGAQATGQYFEDEERKRRGY
jgi:hypothetical protein